MFNFWKKSHEKQRLSAFASLSRVKTINGKLIPAIIHNGSYFFIHLEVYADGAVDCWELTDLEIFKHKLKTGWVKTAIPDGESISVHGLGVWKIADSQWLYTQDTFYEYIFSIVKELNPSMLNLHKHVERVENGVRIGETGNGKIYKEKKRHPKDIFPEQIKGDSIRVFYRVEDKYHLVNLVAFADGQIQLMGIPDEVIFDFTQIEAAAKEGIIQSQVPLQSKVEIYGLGIFTVIEEEYAAAIEDKLLEVKDVIEGLNGRPTSLQKCRALYETYMETPTMELKDKLKTAYENIPSHRRMFIGDMDTKDIPVRMIIYGEKEIENWLHYIVAKKMGEELPQIQVPKPRQ